MSKCQNCYKNKYEKDKIYLFSFQWNCQKEGICIFNKYDHRLCELYVEFFGNKLSQNEITNTTKSIETSYFKIITNIALQDSYKFPTNKNEFIEILQIFNKELFSQTKIDTLIGFRKNEVEVDNDKHKFEGTRSQDVKIHLDKLFEELLFNIEFSSMTKEKFCRRAALFLEHFFRIHPFADGNGRVGRLFLILMARETKRFEFGQFTYHTDGSDNSYINALRKAHKNYNSEDIRKKSTAYTDLEKWLDSKLTEIHSNDLEDVPS